MNKRNDRGLSAAEFRALSLVRDNPRIEGGGQFARAMWPDAINVNPRSGNFLLGRLCERKFVARFHKSNGHSGDKGCNVYWLTETGEIALALEQKRHANSKARTATLARGHTVNPRIIEARANGANV